MQAAIYQRIGNMPGMSQRYNSKFELPHPLQKIRPKKRTSWGGLVYDGLNEII